MNTNTDEFPPICVPKKEPEPTPDANLQEVVIEIPGSSPSKWVDLVQWFIERGFCAVMTGRTGGVATAHTSIRASRPRSEVSDEAPVEAVTDTSHGRSSMV